MDTASLSETHLADAAALMALPDRIAYVKAWLSNMMGGKFQIHHDPMAELYQAEAVLMGIWAELSDFSLAAGAVPSARIDPLGFMREAWAYLDARHVARTTKH